MYLNFFKTICLISLLFSYSVFANSLHEEYCLTAGGVIEEMSVEIMTNDGLVIGQAKKFCNFYVPEGFIAIGLKTFSDAKPSFAATYMKKLPKIDNNSPLLKGKYSNKAQNVCLNLGGTEVSFVTQGGFANQLGQSDICIFGDGSMVSAWSLIYMANNEEEYDKIKNKVKSKPLEIDLP